MRMPSKEKRALERQKKLIFNKIKKHLVKYETVFEAPTDHSEWYYRLILKLPEEKKKPFYDHITFAYVLIDKKNVSFYLYSVFRSYKYMEEAPSLFEYFKRSNVFRFDNTNQVNEKELKKILKHALQEFNDRKKYYVEN